MIIDNEEEHAVKTKGGFSFAKSEIEGARSASQQPSFFTGLFEGSPDFGLLGGQREGPREAMGAREWEKYYDTLYHFVAVQVDPEEIERTAEIPAYVINELRGLGAFGLKIPKQYGGMGLSQEQYGRILTMVAEHCNILSLFLSVQNSIGVARPILLFGNENQKETWLPKIARGLVSAFAFTEPEVGSDPAHMKTTARLVGNKEHGTHYVVNGEKLWITNGTIADVIVLMARVEGKITAFIVDMNTPGIEVAARNEFMGCRGIENAWLKFRDVRVPKENVIGEVGKGLKYALTTLNTGRMSIAAMCLGMTASLYPPTIMWANERKAFGKPIGQHELNTHLISRMREDIFFSRIASHTVARIVDRNGHDLPVESAVAKLVCSEALWRTCETAMNIRGGRGYEKASSLARRGEDPVPVEQIMRDARMYLIGEGASNILRMFIAREALDPHKKRTDRFFKARGWLAKTKEFLRLVPVYGFWYAKQWFMMHGHDTPHQEYVRRTSKRLARAIFHAMVRHGTSLEERQALVARFVDIGVDLFLISLATSYVKYRAGGVITANLAIASAKARIENTFHAIGYNDDEHASRLGRIALKTDR